MMNILSELRARVSCYKQIMGTLPGAIGMSRETRLMYVRALGCKSTAKHKKGIPVLVERGLADGQIHLRALAHPGQPSTVTFTP